jgi:hypothetical protein
VSTNDGITAESKPLQTNASGSIRANLAQCPMAVERTPTHSEKPFDLINSANEGIYRQFLEKHSSKQLACFQAFLPSRFFAGKTEQLFREL